ncbi:MAG: cyclic nucleotide-binding domain-containing protein [Gammaproteobacteria bacterium]|nr:cyclic nucleotide-binding domain-containing protein [Gammaproteobacteria bacterium]MBQ0840252.1 cyclic nucleotide-binding domain-containing protein [Gammaproteobacteria bacterium]
MDESRINLLMQVPVFGAIRKDIIAQLVEQAPLIKVQHGNYLFHEGDKGTSMYIIESGRMAAIKNWGKEEYLLKQLTQGDCIGEMALFDFFPRSASIISTEDTELIKITANDLLNIYHQDLEQFTLLQMNLGREVTRRLRDADEKLFHERMQATIDGDRVSSKPYLKMKEIQH